MNARSTSLATVAAAVVIALLAVGCGGDESAPTSAGGDAAPASGDGETGAESTPQSGSAADSSRGGEADVSGERPPASSSPSKAQFVKKAAPACERERLKLVLAVEDFQRSHSSKGLPLDVFTTRMIKTAVLPGIEAEIAAVRRIGAPEGDEEEIEAILDTRQAAIDEVRELESIPTYKAMEDHFVDVNKTTSEYGLTACGGS